jgi:hypothetical protein
MLAKDRNLRANKESYEEMKRNHLIKRIIQFRKSKLETYFRCYDDNLFQKYTQKVRESKTSLGIGSERNESNKFPIIINPLIKNGLNLEDGYLKLKGKIKFKQSLQNNQTKNMNIEESVMKNCNSIILSGSETDNVNKLSRNNSPIKLNTHSRMKRNSLEKVVHISNKTAIETSTEKLDKYSSNYSQTPFKTNIMTEIDASFPQINRQNNNYKLIKNELLKMNFTYTKDKTSLYNYNTSFPNKKNNFEEIYSSYYTSNKNGISPKVKYIDPLASDDFQRMFNTFKYYKCFSENKKTNKSVLKINEDRQIPKKKVGFNLPTRSFELTLKKKQLFFKGRIFPNNSKNLSIQSCKI